MTSSDATTNDAPAPAGEPNWQEMYAREAHKATILQEELSRLSASASGGREGDVPPISALIEQIGKAQCHHALPDEVRELLNNCMWTFVYQQRSSLVSDASPRGSVLGADETTPVSFVVSSAPASPRGGPTYVVNCCHCGRIIDTREKDEGGDGWGHELSDERWVCSPECLDAVSEPDAAHPAPATVEMRGKDRSDG